MLRDVEVDVGDDPAAGDKRPGGRVEKEIEHRPALLYEWCVPPGLERVKTAVDGEASEGARYREAALRRITDNRGRPDQVRTRRYVRRPICAPHRGPAAARHRRAGQCD